MRAVHTWSGNNYNSSKVEEEDKEEFNFFDNGRADPPAAATNIVQWSNSNHFFIFQNKCNFLHFKVQWSIGVTNIWLKRHSMMFGQAHGPIVFANS